MIQKSARLQYALLALVALLGLAHVVLSGTRSFLNLADGTTLAQQPFFNGSTGRAFRLTPAQARGAGVPEGFVLVTLTARDKPNQDSGPQLGDAVYTIDGRPYTGGTVLDEEVSSHKPGQALDVTFWRQGTSLDSPPVRAALPLHPQRTAPPPLWGWAIQSVFTILPIFCLVTGWYVVFARPLSPFSWLILGILGYISALLLHPGFATGPLVPLSLIWTSLGQTAMPICFMLFGIYFPERASADRRLPWLKWLVLAPTLALFPLDLLEEFAGAYRFSLIAPVYGWLGRINVFENVIAAAAIFYAFHCLQYKLHRRGINPDARRRLRVLNLGSTVGLTPFFVLLLISMFKGTDFGSGMPQWVELTVFALLFVFPLTLAYVVIVQRAVDVRILLRQGTKYFFAKQSILILGVLLASLMSYEISLATLHHGHRGSADVARLVGCIVLFALYRRIGASRMQRWIDQKFFREAYSTEQILSELSEEARNFTETVPLIETIANRLGATLHIDRIAVFLRSGEMFQLQFATGLPIAPGFMPALSSTSTTITNLSSPKAVPANVYRDDPTSWLVSATDAERTALSDLSTELLVPLPGRNRLIGVIALGPKSTEEPYSKTDRQLLQTVASQTGLALENAELLEHLTTELAQRASINREIEIAREVQERLFPQTYPKLPGIDLAGYCRPAQFVGGDYYDFFLIPQPFSTPESPANRLAIAVGDISGKGISAALLMASLRASLRAVATLQQADGSGNGHLATLMQHVNQLVYEASTTNRYATFFYAELDPATRILTYVNAGHNCPVILRRNGTETGQAIELAPTGTVVGLLAGATYEQECLQLHPGDTLLAFTDGISEAMTAEDEEWGEPAMIAAAQRLLFEPACSATAATLLQCLLADADAFTAGAPQHDDMTLLICTLA